MRAHVRGNLDLALDALEHSSRLQAQPPDGGYYLFPSVAGWDEEEDLVLHLLEHGVLVHPGYFYGYHRGTHIMLSCLTETRKLRAGLELLLSALA